MEDSGNNQGAMEFLLKEVEHVRKSSEGLIEETRRLERYAILVTGATWSWCATSVESPAFSYLIWFPTIACFLFGIRAAGLYYLYRSARQYVANVESMFTLPRQLGWETTQIKNSEKMPEVVVNASAYLFWFILGIGTLVVPIIYLSLKSNS